MTFTALAIGGIALPFSFRPQIRSWSRASGSLVGLAVAVAMMLVWSDLVIRYPSTSLQNPAPLVSILMIGVICLLLNPVHTLAFGLAVSAIYLGALLLVLQPMPGMSMPWYFLLEMAIWVIICAVLTAVL